MDAQRTSAALTPPLPSVRPWEWREEILIDGAPYPATFMFSPVADYTRTAIVSGIAPNHLDRLLISAQGSPTPHGWRVDEQRAEDSVDPDTLAKARQLYQRDVDQYGNVFVSFLGEQADGSYELLGCASARRHISPTYVSVGWVVIVRLLALPDIRGRGFGRHFNMAFFALSQSLCGPSALGCFIATETEQTRRLCEKAVAGGALDMVPCGRKRWDLLDHTLEFEVFMAFYSGMRQWALATGREGRRRAGLSSALERFLDATEAVWQRGYDAPAAARLARQFSEVEPELEERARNEPALALYHDFLASARAHGTLLAEWDPT
jgi:hypothetical protein